jgi:hypothetical protein
MPARLLRLELRRNAMVWMLPLIAVLFWFDIYHRSMTLPPLWSLRIMRLEQDHALPDFAPFVAGAAAWMGSRDGRRGTTDLVAVTARPRWAAQLTSWAATTSWAMLTYLVCVGVFYGVTAHQVTWGGPPLWPVAVGAAGITAFAALGFAAGPLVPSRFTAPLAAIVAFLMLFVGQVSLQHNATYALISPMGTSAYLSPDSGNFYPFLPDLSIAQIMFLCGLGIAALGVMGLPLANTGPWLRSATVALTVAGLASAGTAIGLTGTARVEANGVVIPALHDAASDQAIRYTPYCRQATVAVCVQPAYRMFLPDVIAAVSQVLGEVSQLPGAPASVAQSATFLNSLTGAGQSDLGAGSVSGNPPVLYIPLGSDQPGQVPASELIGEIRTDAAPLVVDAVVGTSQGKSGSGDPAQQAVAAAMLKAVGMQLVAPLPGTGIVLNLSTNQAPGPAPGTAAYAAVLRFDAQLPAVRHAWLAAHLVALRARQITLAEIP